MEFSSVIQQSVTRHLLLLLVVVIGRMRLQLGLWVMMLRWKINGKALLWPQLRGFQGCRYCWRCGCRYRSIRKWRSILGRKFHGMLLWTILQRIVADVVRNRYFAFSNMITEGLCRHRKVDSSKQNVRKKRELERLLFGEHERTHTHIQKDVPERFCSRRFPKALLPTDFRWSLLQVAKSALGTPALPG